MKHIENFIIERLNLDSFMINERLTLNADSKIKQKKEFIFDEHKWKEGVQYLKDLAKEKGLEVRFINHTNNAGDFHIFLYDKSKKKDYIIGLDGYWHTNEEWLSFPKLCKDAEDWINSYI